MGNRSAERGQPQFVKGQKTSTGVRTFGLRAALSWYRSSLHGLTVNSFSRSFLQTGVVTTAGDFACGAVGMLVVLEFGRRASGLVLFHHFAGLCCLCHCGAVASGLLRHSGFQTDNLFSFLYSQDAIFGMTVAASSIYIVLFVAFAVSLKRPGQGNISCGCPWRFSGRTGRAG